MYPHYEKLCCFEKHIKMYEDYYVKQAGSGLPVFGGASFQKGYRIGSVFGSIGRVVLPLRKSRAKAVGKEALKSGKQFLGDILEENNVKQAAATRAKAAGKICIVLPLHTLVTVRRVSVKENKKKRQKQNPSKENVVF